jgi:hypothetical protein
VYRNAPRVLSDVTGIQVSAAMLLASLTGFRTLGHRGDRGGRRVGAGDAASPVGIVARERAPATLIDNVDT